MKAHCRYLRRYRYRHLIDDQVAGLGLHSRRQRSSGDKPYDYLRFLICTEKKQACTMYVGETSQFNLSCHLNIGCLEQIHVTGVDLGGTIGEV